MNPLIEGILVKCLADVIHELFVQADATGAAKADKPWLDPLSAVLSVVVTLIGVATTTGLGGISTDQIGSVLTTLVTVFLGTKAAGTATLRGIAGKCKTEILTLLQKP